MITRGPDSSAADHIVRTGVYTVTMGTDVLTSGHSMLIDSVDNGHAIP